MQYIVHLVNVLVLVSHPLSVCLCASKSSCFWHFEALALNQTAFANNCPFGSCSVCNSSFGLRKPSQWQCLPTALYFPLTQQEQPQPCFVNGILEGSLHSLQLSTPTAGERWVRKLQLKEQEVTSRLYLESACHIAESSQLKYLCLDSESEPDWLLSNLVLAYFLSWVTTHCLTHHRIVAGKPC